MRHRQAAKTNNLRAFNKAEKQIEKAYYASCSGLAIPILKIGDVFEEGHRLLGEGVDEDGLRAGLRRFTETLAAEA